jgi:hypothetical protein
VLLEKYTVSEECKTMMMGKMKELVKLVQEDRQLAKEKEIEKNEKIRKITEKMLEME